MNTTDNIKKQTGRLLAVTVVTLIASLFPFVQVLADHDGWKGGIDRERHNNHKLQATIMWGDNYSSNYTFQTGYTSYNISGYVKQLKISSWYLSLYKTYDQWIDNNKTCSSYDLSDQRLEWNIYNSQTSNWDYYWSYIYGTTNYPECSNCCLVYPDTYWETETGNMIQYLIDNGTGGNYSLNMLLSVKKADGGNRDYFPSAETKMVCDITVPGFYAQSTSFTTVKHDAGVQSKDFKFKAWAFGSATVTLSVPNDSPFGFNSDCSSKTTTVSNPSDGSEKTVTLYFDPSTAGEHQANLSISGVYNSSTITKTVSVSGVSTNQPIVIEGDKPEVGGNSAVLSGYVQAYDCTADLYGAGFYYWLDGADEESTKVRVYTLYEADEAHPFKTRGTWSNTVTGLTPNTTYRYRPFVKKTTDGDEAEYVSSDYYKFTTSTCDPSIGDTIYFTIDANAVKDECALVFNTIAEAKTYLAGCTSGVKNWTYAEDDATYPFRLKKHIVFQVAPGLYQTGSGKSGAIDLKNINKWDTGKKYTPDHRFVLRGIDPDYEKTTLYGLDIRESRWITIDNIKIERENENRDYDNSALVAGAGNISNSALAGNMENASIRIVNSKIVGTSFCVIHVDSCDGIEMENNNLSAAIPDYSGDNNLCNAVFWGSSIKMFNVKNARIMRNNFRGSHTTSLLLQGSNNLLIMNNVFWNNNSISDPTRRYVAFIRLLSMSENTSGGDSNELKNIGIYYNTLFLMANNETENYKCDFFRLGASNSCGDSQENVKFYDGGTIEFMYNNCYSMSGVVDGKGSFNESDPFLGLENQFDKISDNNFWSYFDGASASESVFAIGEDNTFINSEAQMCKTAPYDPDGLVIKGGALNGGIAVATTVGNSLGAQRVRTDRTGVSNIRPKDGTRWTYGAYQQGVSETIHRIYWFGTENNRWDNRNNWYKDKDGKVKVSCVDELSADLEVIIPSGKPQYPVIGDWNELTTGEEVRTGIAKVDDGYTATAYTNTMDIEYGAALLGVENLYKNKVGSRRYTKATTNFEAGRKHWLLVGSVIKENAEDEGLTSYSFYKYHKPEVYMQRVEADAENDEIKWGTPFTDLDTPLPAESCFAIMVADEYTGEGYYKIPAYYYSLWTGEDVGSGTEDVKYQYTGYFVNENALPSYTVAANSYGLFSNTYPANISVTQMQNNVLGEDATLHFYKYVKDDEGNVSGSWMTTESLVSGEKYYIRPQNGFAIKNNTGSSLTVAMELEDYENEGVTTRYKRADANTKLILGVSNAVSGGESRVTVKYNGGNTAVLIGVNTSTPIAYVPSGDKSYCVFGIEDESRIVPLTVLNQSSNVMHVKFDLLQSNGFESVILEDRLNNMSYDLLNGDTPTFYSLASGETSGRFYLNINYASDSSEDNPVTVAEETKEDAAIDIYNVGAMLTVTASEGSVIESISVSDMAGKTYRLIPNGNNFSRHKLPVVNGVYVVSVVTNKNTAQTKIVVK